MMTSMSRVLTTLSGKEPDRVPLFLLLTMHGAKELGLSIKEYFSKAEYVVEGQLRLLKKYEGDCIYAFFYAPLEIEAFGGEVIYSDDGPPNSGEPFMRDTAKIASFEPPRIADCQKLQKVLEAIKALKNEVRDEVPIIGVVMAPFSLPVMQMGFDKYFDIMHESPELMARLMAANEQFCADWANAQLEAGATAICYFDPVSSTTITTESKYLETGYQAARRTLSKIKGPTATHMASGNCLGRIGKLAETGTAIVGVSARENIGEIKKECGGRLSVLGNLNGIEMRKWTREQAEGAVKKCIAGAASGGGFILSDNHGEIPFQTPDETVFAISAAAKKWGTYPLDWIENNG